MATRRSLWMRCGGEKYSPKLLDNLKAITKARIFNTYGPTEITVSCNAKELTNADMVCVGKPLLNYMSENLPAGKKVFILFTSAMNRASLSSSAKKVIEEKKCQAVGQYSCPGYNTFGPFKLIGGTAKGHPTKEELDAAVEFYKGL